MREDCSPTSCPPSRWAALALGELPDPLPIPTVSRAFDVTLRPPGSKSLTNRALLLAALADGESTLTGALTDADDAQVMLGALRLLGVVIEQEGATLRVGGVGGRWKPASLPLTLNLNNAGTATRFLTAACVLIEGRGGREDAITIDGNQRMRERPIAELVDALKSLGVRVSFPMREGYPPVVVHAPGDLGALEKNIEFPATASSQFISAMVMLAPHLPGGLTITSREHLTSPAYIDMSVSLMRRLNVRFETTTPERGETLRIHVPAQRVAPFAMEIEPDASGATYLHAAAALVPGARCEVRGLDIAPSSLRTSLQGDARFVQVLSAFGAAVERTSVGLRVTGARTLLPVDVDLSDMPDTAMTAAVLACFAAPTPENPRATSHLRGLRTLRVKETDRLAALQNELGKIGASVEIVQETLHGVRDETLRITPAIAATSSPVEFTTYDDHRMAMALSLVGLRRSGVSVGDPSCVRKTYPNYFADLANMYA